MHDDKTNCALDDASVYGRATNLDQIYCESNNSILIYFTCRCIFHAHV